ncbi:hypothetical protein LAZ40_18315 [Cereibacter sphaeroides]|uniref:NepR family anti-sigma factor n=1 Tax=Rhodobacterales TaxID=204455 RepID=UPI0018E09706|nr:MULTISPECIES: NepR family anti-sigma factor [Paracoccaceae]MCE6952320.1 hypothetical protein [Cereibacter sphaeroides]MCE6960985.1 hypothetical protein [Cereibacter sphaeroides]MCE6969717.1 hypothetical protein [Cereibacter sphaeroides]MCE6975192.1 hypothetical protein [Cereibacter sphaeroides]
MAQSTEPKASPERAKVNVRDKAKEKGRKAIQQQIDENLRRVYEEALVQEIPDRFAQLLEQLRLKETEG